MIKAFKQETQWVCMAMIASLSMIPISGASDLLAEDLAVPTTTPCSTINASVSNWAGASKEVLQMADQEVRRKPKNRGRRRRKNNLPGLIGKRRYLMKQSEKSQAVDMKLQMRCWVASMPIFLLSFGGSNRIRVPWISPEMKLETWIRKIWGVLLGT